MSLSLNSRGIANNSTLASRILNKRFRSCTSPSEVQPRPRLDHDSKQAPAPKQPVGSNDLLLRGAATEQEVPRRPRANPTSSMPYWNH
jgi:hypothetical protein